MNEIIRGVNKLYISEDYWGINGYKGDLLDRTFNSLYIMGMKRSFGNLIGAYGAFRQTDGIYALFAHGNNYRNNWIYWDGTKNFPVQDWVDSVDGRSAAIFLFCCNPLNNTVASHESIVVHSTKAARHFNYLIGANLRLYFPGEGYLDDTTRIKQLTAQLNFR